MQRFFLQSRCFLPPLLFLSMHISSMTSSPFRSSSSCLSSSTHILAIVIRCILFLLLQFPSFKVHHQYDHHHLPLLLHHHPHHHHRSFRAANITCPTEEYLSLLVLSELSWTPVPIEAEQQDQHFQFPQSREGRGLRE